MVWLEDLLELSVFHWRVRVTYFYFPGDTAILQNRKVRTREERGMGAYIQATGGIWPESQCVSDRRQCRPKTGHYLHRYSSILSASVNLEWVRAVNLAISRRPHTAEAWVWSWFSPCGFCSRPSGTGSGLSSCASVSPCQCYSTTTQYSYRISKSTGHKNTFALFCSF